MKFGERFDPLFTVQCWFGLSDLGCIALSFPASRAQTFSNPSPSSPFGFQIAVCESGQCSLVVKARNAQNAGAIALVILCSEQEIDREVYFNKPKPRVDAHTKEPEKQRGIEESLDRLHATLKHKQQKHKAQNASHGKSGGHGGAVPGPKRRKSMMGQDLAEVAAAEAAAGVPEYERRSMIRIPVVLAEKTKARGVKTGSKVKIHIYDADQQVKLDVWPYELATMESSDADVRG